MLNIFSLIPDWVLVKMPRNNILLFLIDTAFLGFLLKSMGMITASFQGFPAYRRNPILNHIEQQRTSLLATILTISIVSSSMFKLVSSNNLLIHWHEIHPYTIAIWTWRLNHYSLIFGKICKVRLIHMHNPSIHPSNLPMSLSVYSMSIKLIIWTNNEQLEFKVTKGFKPSFLLGR